MREPEIYSEQIFSIQDSIFNCSHYVMPWISTLTQRVYLQPCGSDQHLPISATSMVLVTTVPPLCFCAFGFLRFYKKSDSVGFFFFLIWLPPLRVMSSRLLQQISSPVIARYEIVIKLTNTYKYLPQSHKTNTKPLRGTPILFNIFLRSC